MNHSHTDKFSLQIRVQENDIDELGHVNNVIYLRWVQEVAAAHWRQVAPESMQQRYAWVVLRHEIDYLRPAFRSDSVTGYTWVGEHSGARFDRFVSLYRTGTDELLAKAKTSWCLLEAASMRPKRIEEEILSIL